MRITVDGTLSPHVAAKDVILAIIGRIGAGGAVRHVIEYAGSRDPRARHGSAHDDLQHEHRGRRARRHGRAGRDHVRMARRPSARTARFRRGGRGMAHAARATPMRAFDREVSLARGRDRADRHLGHQPGDGDADHRARARPRRGIRCRTARAHAGTARLHGSRCPARRSTASRSIASSSAAAPTAGSPICAPPPPCCAGAAPWCPASSCPARCR